MAVGGKPCGPKASLKASIAAMLTGSEPMIATTLARSRTSPCSPGTGLPRSAAHS